MPVIQYLHMQGAKMWRFERQLMMAATLGIALLAVCATTPAMAEDGGAGASPVVDVAVDEARVMKLNRAPSSVVVGNPLIADAVMEQNGVMFLIGRNYGTTNIIALDEAGEVIANYDIVVRTGGRNAVSLYRGTDRVALNCSPRCESELDVGDGPEHFEIIRTQVENKTALSNAQAGGGRR